ncbi:MAG: hypothetical protein NUW01_13425 [Gemmatimonadaceae bacterium]|nr:hypothetical protein [Gemmatimonadaceae bacterium]
MSKPYGMTPWFEIVRPSEAQNAIYGAVESAIEAGMSVEQFRREAWECWEIVRREQAEREDKAWRESR